MSLKVYDICEIPLMVTPYFADRMTGMTAESFPRPSFRRRAEANLSLALRGYVKPYHNAYGQITPPEVVGGLIGQLPELEPEQETAACRVWNLTNKHGRTVSKFIRE